MRDPVIRTCPSCGARLQIADELLDGTGNVQVRVDQGDELARLRIDLDIQMLKTDLAKLRYQRYEVLILCGLADLVILVVAQDMHPYVQIGALILLGVAALVQYFRLQARTNRMDFERQYLESVRARMSNAESKVAKGTLDL